MPTTVSIFVFRSYLRKAIPGTWYVFIEKTLAIILLSVNNAYRYFSAPTGERWCLSIGYLSSFVYCCVCMCSIIGVDRANRATNEKASVSERLTTQNVASTNLAPWVGTRLTSRLKIKTLSPGGKCTYLPLFRPLRSLPLLLIPWFFPFHCNNSCHFFQLLLFLSAGIYGVDHPCRTSCFLVVLILFLHWLLLQLWGQPPGAIILLFSVSSALGLPPTKSSFSSSLPTRFNREVSPSRLALVGLLPASLPVSRNHHGFASTGTERARI